MSVYMLKYRISTLILVSCYAFIIQQLKLLFALILRNTKIIILSILYDNILNFILHIILKYKRDVWNRSTCFNSRQFAMMAEIYMNMSGQTCNHCNYINNIICTGDKYIPLTSLCCILLIYINLSNMVKRKGYIIKYIVIGIESSKYTSAF